MKHNKGFTLIELLVVISIIGVLATIVLPSLSSARRKAKVAAFRTGWSQIAQGILLYQLDTGNHFPATAFYGNKASLSAATGPIADFKPYIDFEAMLDNLDISSFNFIISEGNASIQGDEQVYLQFVTKIYDKTYMEKQGFSTLEYLGGNVDYEIIFQYSDL